MGLSFKDSLNKVKENNNARMINNNISPMSLDDDVSAYDDISLTSLDDESAVAATSDSLEGWTRSSNYLYYEEYSDDNISNVDDLKNVLIDKKQINLTQESNSQYIPFKMPRRYDGFDLLNTTIIIHYVNKDGYEDRSNVVNVYYNEEYIRFGWLVNKNATAVEGTLEFEIIASGVNSKGDEYVWKTKPNNQLSVLKSLAGNGAIEPDNTWITSFMTQVNEKVAEAQRYAQEAKTTVDGISDYADKAEASANKAQQAVDTAKIQLEGTVGDAVNNKVDAALSSYYTKIQVDNIVKNIDISDQLEEVKQQIANLDGLAKFNVTYDGSKMTFYNGETVMKEIAITSNPTEEWTTQYTAGVDKKINDAKTEADEKFATKASLNTTNTNVASVTSTANANKENVTKLGDKVAKFEETINGLDTSPRLTYDATYDEEHTYTLWEIQNEGKSDEKKEAKAQFKIQGGGGGGGTSSILKITYITTTPVVATLDDKIIIKYNFSRTDSSGDVGGDGTATWKVDGSIVATNTAASGENSFDITDHITVGTHKVNLSIVDDAGSLVTKTWTVQRVDVRLESSFNDSFTYPIGKVSFDYTPYGAIQKKVHFILDGNEIGTVDTAVSGVPLAYDLPAQTHGAHLLEVYMTAEVNGKAIESNHIVKDIIWYDSTSDKPVIGCVKQKFTAKQYDTTNIVYTVYDPSTETPQVTLAVDGKTVSTLTIDSNTQTWQFKSSDVGAHTLTITCRDTVKTLTVNVEKLDIDVEPVVAGLAFDFNPVGKSNNDTDRLWSDGDVAMTVSDNFDWVNGGYQIDDNGDQYFGVKAGTTATISYNLFADDAKKNGKEFKLIFKTTNVAKSNATFLTCQSGTTSDVGLQMNVHEAYIKSSAKSLYIPYSEEDIIEWEFNINKDTDIPIVMSYEDGTPCRPMSYTGDYSFTQDSPVPITIGSPDCDVLIYRMKAYNTSLTSSAILSNFIADARTATEMIDRYTRNQIYDENKLLTPESVASACPNMRVIKIEAPHFTNNKKDFVGNTSFECIYKNGDAVLDNWKFENCYHSGQGTTSNEYGAAGRNIDLIAGFDGKHQVTSKVELDPNYITKLTFGDGSTVTDGSGKIALTRTSVPNNWFNVKVNIASSEMVNNAYLQKRYNDYIPYSTPATRRDSRIKNDMEFVNCVIFIKESDPDLTTHREFQDTSWHYYALGNIGDSKKTDVTRAYDPDDMKEFTIEISDNTLPNSIFQTGVTKSDGSMKYPITKAEWAAGNEAYDALHNDWDGSFEFRYDCCGDTKDGSSISTDEEKTKIRTQNRQIWRDFYEFIITSTDDEFKNNLGNWFIVDSALYFYLFTLRYTMIDNRAKNTFWHWAKHYITTAEATTLGDKAAYYTVDDAAAGINNGYRFDLWDYDNDSALGINNSGELTMTYGKEDTDYRTDGDQSSGYVFNAAESVFFCRVRDLMGSDLQKMYVSRESKNCWSASSLINQFDEKQNEWCEELWRVDYVRKYERPYKDGNTRFLEQMMNGKKKYQRRQFERDQEMYMATKFIGNTATSDQIMFRCNTPKDAVVAPNYTLHLTPFSDMYLSVMFGNSSPTQVRAKAGKQYDITCPYDTMDDTAVLIYGASRIQSVGDVSACYIHDNDFSKAEKLKELIIGNATEGYSNTFLTNLVIGNNKLLEKLDIRNTPNLVSSLDFSKCMNLEELYASGSGLRGVLFASGGSIRLAQLPATLTSINMKNLMYLTNLSIAGYDSISTLIIENCDTVDVKDLLDKANNVSRVRITGIDWTLEDTSLLDRIYKMSGIDKNGYNVDKAVLAGTVHVPVVKQQQLYDYQEAWPDLEIVFNTMVEQFIVKFVNYDDTVLDTQYVDKGGNAVDPLTRADNPIDTPTKPSSVSTDFTFKKWDLPLTGIFSDRTIKATYSETTRRYTIKYVSRGVTLQESTGLYGENVEYTGAIPTYTLEENAYKYYMFDRWDKSGFIDGDKTVNAIFDTFTYAPTALAGKELKDMRPVEVYAITKLGLDSSGANIQAGDAYSFNMGYDIDYDDITSKTVISEKTVFAGKNYVDTGIKLFDTDKDFVLAIDYKFLSGTSEKSVLAQCFQSNGSNGFKLWSNGGIKMSWGTSSTGAGSVGSRDMVVLRHKKGDDNIYVYYSNLNGNEPDIVKLERTKSTIIDSTLVFGCSKADDGAYENYAVGNVYWSKIWYEDLGDTVCKKLVSWTHENVALEVCSFKKYYLSNEPSKRCTFSLLAKHLLDRKHVFNENGSNAGGWTSSDLNSFLNTRFYEALPIKIKLLIKQVTVNSSIGNGSKELSASQCYVSIPAAIELSNSYEVSGEPFVNEGEIISYMTSNDARKRAAVDGDYTSYWTRSQNVSYTNYIYTVNEQGDLYGFNTAGTQNGVLIEISF
jgi:hypothetical protein|nr:MAG TPA: hypothetical protein [Caudoviricetes sp.]